MTYQRVVIVGIGGGWTLPTKTACFLNYYMPDALLVLVDGGQYRTTQLDHEHFLRLGNKATVQEEMLAQQFPALRVRAHPRYLTKQITSDAVRLDKVIQDGDIVFVQVDNYATIHDLIEHSQKLRHATLLIGGTTQDRLRTLVYLRRGGRKVTADPRTYCHGIAEPNDRDWLDERRHDCTSQLGERQDRHPFTMMAASSFLLNAFYEVWKRDSNGEIDGFPYHELWFDIGAGRCRTETHAITGG